MKSVIRIVVLVGLLALSASISRADQRIWGVCDNGGVTLTVPGIGQITQTVVASYPNCQVAVYYTGTTNLVIPIYRDDLGDVKSNPFNADPNTGYFFFYIPNGRYDLRFSGAGISSPFTFPDILAFDPAGVLGTIIEVNGASVANPFNLNGTTPSADSGFLALTFKCTGTPSTACIVEAPVGTASGTLAAGNDARIVGAEQTANKNQANGYAGLDFAARILPNELPPPGGDVGATYSSTTVTGLHFGATGLGLSSTAPTSGQCLLDLAGSIGGAACANGPQNIVPTSLCSGADVGARIQNCDAKLSGSGVIQVDTPGTWSSQATVGANHTVVVSAALTVTAQNPAILSAGSRVLGTPNAPVTWTPPTCASAFSFASAASVSNVEVSGMNVTMGAACNYAYLFTTSGTLANATFRGNTTTGLNPVWFNGVTGGTIDANVVDGTGLTTLAGLIQVAGSPGAPTANVVVSGNKFSSVPTDMIEIWGGDGATDLTLSLTSVAPGTGAYTGMAVYTGSFSGGGSNAYAGMYFIVGTFPTNPTNNGTFLCFASAAGSLVLENSSSVSESASATAIGGPGAIPNYTRGATGITVSHNVGSGAIFFSSVANSTMDGNTVDGTLPNGTINPSSDVGLDCEGCLNVSITGNTSKNFKNACLSLQFGNQGVVAANNTLLKTVASTSIYPDTQGTMLGVVSNGMFLNAPGVTPAGNVLRGNSYKCLVPHTVCSIYVQGSQESVTFDGENLINTRFSAQGTSRLTLKNISESFNTTYNGSTPWNPNVINQQIEINGLAPVLSISGFIVQSDVAQPAGSSSLYYNHTDSNSDTNLLVQVDGFRNEGNYPFPVDVYADGSSAGGGTMRTDFRNDYFGSGVITSISGGLYFSNCTTGTPESPYPSGSAPPAGGSWVLGTLYYNSVSSAFSSGIYAWVCSQSGGCNNSTHWTPIPMGSAKTVTLSNGANEDVDFGSVEYAFVTGPTAAFSIGGIQGGWPGRNLVILNGTTQSMTVVNADTGSTAANRISTETGSDAVIPNLGYSSSATLRYEPVYSLWTLVSAWPPSAVPINLVQHAAVAAAANSVGFQAPVSVTSPFHFTLPGAPAAGVLRATNATPSVLSASPIGAADMPNPTASTLGGIESKTCTSSTWINDISTGGVPTCTQPSTGDLSDVADILLTSNAIRHTYRVDSPVTAWRLVDLNSASGVIPAAGAVAPLGISESTSGVGTMVDAFMPSTGYSEGAITAGHLVVQATSDKTRLSDSGQTSLALVSSQTLTLGVATASVADGNVFAVNLWPRFGTLVGNAATATNLASYPATCTGVNFSQGLSSGSNNCAQPSNVTGNATTATTAQRVNSTQLYADQYASVQAAITALGGAGTVYLTCGKSYTGPTLSSVPSNTSFASTCPSNHALNELGRYSTTLTFTASQTLGPALGMSFHGVNFDFTTTNSTFLTITSVQSSVFDMSVNCMAATEPTACVVVTASAGSDYGYDTAGNTFDMAVWGGQTPFLISGEATPHPNVVTLNHFSLWLYSDLASIHSFLSLVQQCDSNTFDVVNTFGPSLTTISGAIIFNDTVTPTVDSDANMETMGPVGFTGPNSVTGPFFLVNQSVGIEFKVWYGVSQFSQQLKQVSTYPPNIDDLPAYRTIGFGPCFAPTSSASDLSAAGCILPPISGIINGQAWNLPAYSGTLAADNQLTANQNYTGPGFVLDNSNFVAGVDYWVTYNATVAQSTQSPITGGYSARVTTATQYAGIFTLRWYAVTPGHTLFVQGQILSDGTFSAGIGTLCFEGNGTQIFTGGAATTPTVSTSWASYSGSGTVPANAAYCSLGFVRYDAGGGSQIAYVTNLTLTDAAPLVRSCSISLGDGLNAIPAGTYPIDFQCKNDTGQTLRVTGVSCATDNSGSSTCTVSTNAPATLIVAAITGSTGTWVAGNQSGAGTNLITSGQWLKATFVSDGVSKIVSLDVVGTL